MITTEFVTAPDNPSNWSPPKLGRAPAIDERSKYPQYRMATPTSERYYRNWLSPAWKEWPAVLDQGNTPQCVGYGLTKLCLAHKVANLPVMTPTALYNRAQQLDEWPGENYAGTSTNGGLKALREAGVITRWTWADEIEMITRHVLEIGPVSAGTDWTEGMFTADSHGYIWPTGQSVGGHLWLIVGANRKRKNPNDTIGAYRMLNSWGGSWAQKGRAWVSFDTMEKLLAGLGQWPGEAAAVDEVDLIKGG